MTRGAEQELMSLPAPVRIEQAYISFIPEVRIRKRTYRSTGELSWRLTIKGAGGLSRIEISRELLEEEYEQLMTMRQGYSIIKQYHPDFYGFEASVAAVRDTNDIFCYAEKEFINEKDAMSFRIKDFPILARDITNEAGWKMASIARSGGIPR